MGLTHTPESKVMAVWIFRELLCLISSVSIYYEPESEIRVKCYDHLNFSKASVVHFQASRHIMGLTHTPESKVIAFWICRELSCSITTVSIYNVQELTSEWNGMTIWISRELPLFIFERLGISWASHVHPSRKLWPFEFPESFRVQFRPSRYMMRLNQHPSEMLWPFELLESFRCSFLSVLIFDGPHTFTRVKSYGCLNIPIAYVFNFERLDILCVGIRDRSENFWPFEFLESINGSFSSVSK